MIDSRATGQRQIENYALIGNCETAALIGRDGSIDWLCWPRFDSGACFSALLGGRSTEDGSSRQETRGLGYPWIERLEDAGLRAVAGPDMAVLRTPVSSPGA